MRTFALLNSCNVLRFLAEVEVEVPTVEKPTVEPPKFIKLVNSIEDFYKVFLKTAVPLLEDGVDHFNSIFSGDYASGKTTKAILIAKHLNLYQTQLNDEATAATALAAAVEGDHSVKPTEPALIEIGSEEGGRTHYTSRRTVLASAKLAREFAVRKLPGAGAGAGAGAVGRLPAKADVRIMSCSDIASKSWLGPLFHMQQFPTTKDTDQGNDTFEVLSPHLTGAEGTVAFARSQFHDGYPGRLLNLILDDIDQTEYGILGNSGFYEMVGEIRYVGSLKLITHGAFTDAMKKINLDAGETTFDKLRLNSFFTCFTNRPARKQLLELIGPTTTSPGSLCSYIDEKWGAKVLEGIITETAEHAKPRSCLAILGNATHKDCAFLIGPDVFKDEVDELAATIGEQPHAFALLEELQRRVEGGLWVEEDADEDELSDDSE